MSTYIVRCRKLDENYVWSVLLIPILSFINYDLSDVSCSEITSHSKIGLLQ